MPFEAWAVQKLFSRVCHSLSHLALLLFSPATNQLWFLRRSIWLTTGWRMIWGKFSRRRRGGFEWSREGRTLTHSQQPEVRTGSLIQTQPAGVMICSLFHVILFSFLTIFTLIICFFFQVLQFPLLPVGVSQ